MSIRAALTALLVLASGLFMGSEASARPQPVTTFTIQSTDLPSAAAAAAAAWSKNTVLDIATGPCSGAGCIVVTASDDLCGATVPVGGCAETQADGSCQVRISSLVTTVYTGAIDAVTTHEVGHCIGLPHVTTDPRSIMVPSFPLGSPPKGPSAGDRKLVNAIYS